MRIFRGIVQRSTEPQDKETLWLYDDILHYFNNGGWQPLKANSEDVLYIPDKDGSINVEPMKVSTALTLLFKLGLITKDNEAKLNILNGDNTIEGSVDYKIEESKLKYVDIEIEDKEGVPSGSAEIIDNVLYIQMSGIKGEQGNSGYTGALDELEVVNNLTEGGATKALSAEMGKNLYDTTEKYRKEVSQTVLAFNINDVTGEISVITGEESIYSNIVIDDITGELSIITKY